MIIKQLEEVCNLKRLSKNKNIQVIHASSKTQDATVFDISDKGLQMFQEIFRIFLMLMKWYQKMVTGSIV